MKISLVSIGKSKANRILRSIIKACRFGDPTEMRSLARLPRPTAARVREALAALATDPGRRDLDIRPVVGRAYLRVRVGDYRILYQVHADRLTVAVIAHRSAAYR